MQGAVLASSPGEVARNSDVVFTIVGYPSDVRSVILGDDGILANLKPGGIVVDMTTSEPALAQEIAKAAAGKNCAALDCPVSGGDIGAKKGTLTIFAGGDEPAVEAVAPLLECMGKINKLVGVKESDTGHAGSLMQFPCCCAALPIPLAQIKAILAFWRCY